MNTQESAKAQAQICTMSPAEKAELVDRAAEICDRVLAEPEPTPPRSYRDIRQSLQAEQQAAELTRREEAAAEATAERHARFDAAHALFTAEPKADQDRSVGYRAPRIDRNRYNNPRTGRVTFRRRHNRYSRTGGC